jgi:predicted metal-dependent phosphoesterase TrpH
MTDPVAETAPRAVRARPPAWAIAISAAVLGSAVLPAPPLRDLLTNDPPAGAQLVRPALYVFFAPASNVLDALTLLSLWQHVALTVTLVVLFALWRVTRMRVAARDDGSVRRAAWRTEARAALLAIGLFAATYVVMAAAPRPMAALRLRDESFLAVDFHSHTNASYDARPGFSAEENRAWHQAAGYGAAYVSDHHSFRGVHIALATNPATAGDTTMLLPALEAAYQDQHVIVLGSAHDAGTAPVRVWANARSTSAEDVGLILTIPGTVALFAHTRTAPPARAVGIEISDGGPQGLVASDRKRASIIALADRHDDALLTGSDNHGWGRTAAAWSVMTIPGWRGLSADSLDARIRATLVTSGRRAVRPIGRTRAVGGDVPALLVTAPAAAWTMLRALSWPERLSWIAWCWTTVAIASAVRGVRRRRQSRRPPIAHSASA